MKNKLLSIIIISFNTKELLRDCLLSIYKSLTIRFFEIIIVDNASTDGSSEMIETDFKEVKIIKNIENKGFAKANNQALQIAKGKYFLLLNSDTILKGGAIETIVGFMENHEEVAAVGPKVLNIDGTLQSKGRYFPSIYEAFLLCFRIYKFFPSVIRKNMFPKIFRDDNTICKVDWVSGCCILLRKDVVDKIGLLDESFFFYGEEVEWCYRAKKADYNTYYLPNAEIFHYGGASKIDRPLQRYIDTQKALYEKCFGKSKGILITILHILTITLSIIKIIITDDILNEKNVLKSKIKLHSILLKKLCNYPAQKK